METLLVSQGALFDQFKIFKQCEPSLFRKKTSRYVSSPDSLVQNFLKFASFRERLEEPPNL